MLLPVGEKKLCLAVLGSLTMTCVVVPPLPVILTDVSQKVWLSFIIIITEGPTLKTR